MNEICPRSECTGCKACISSCPNNCITMQNDNMDIPYPVINSEKCINCGKCNRSCPNCSKLVKFHNTKRVYASWSKDKQIRMQSASGGVASEFYRYFFNIGGFNSGVCFDGLHAKFVPIRDLKDIELVRNSKYVYSDTNDIYKEIKSQLINSVPVLFIGLPCQVAGLYAFLGKEFDNLITVDIVCHGVVPSEYFQQHVNFIEKRRNAKAKVISFRDPLYYTYTYTFTLSDNKGKEFYRKQVYEDDVYQLGYHKALIYRENCYNCKYAQQKRVGDLTICDFSGVGQYAPFNYDCMKVSCVLVNTNKGSELLDKMTESLYIEERPKGEAFDFEPQLNVPYKPHVHRSVFKQEYLKSRNFEKAASKALVYEIDEYRQRNPGLIKRLIIRIKMILPQSVKNVIKKKIDVIFS